MKVGFRLKIFFLCFLSTATLASPTTDELDNADYLSGKNAFQQRCSACHTLAADSANIVGPNLWQIFGKGVGEDTSFNYSSSMAFSIFIFKSSAVNTDASLMLSKICWIRLSFRSIL